MGAAIEAPLALLQIPGKALFGDIVEPAHMPLGLIPEVFDAVDVAWSRSFVSDGFLSRRRLFLHMIRSRPARVTGSRCKRVSCSSV